jgi:hypothetical protein
MRQLLSVLVTPVTSGLSLSSDLLEKTGKTALEQMLKVSTAFSKTGTYYV